MAREFRPYRRRAVWSSSVGRTTCCVTILLAFLIRPAFVWGLSAQELDQRLASCNGVLDNILHMPDKSIPRDLLNRCRGLAIFPGVVGVSVVIGLRYGSGVVLRRDDRTGVWSKPAFFTIRGGSVGAQIGAQSVDLILLVMSEEGVQALLEEQFTLGADVSATAGPVGRAAAAGTNLGFGTGILSYSRSKGLFAGISLTGARLEPDVAANTLYHGDGVTVQDVFYENLGNLTDAGKDLIATLNSVSPGKFPSEGKTPAEPPGKRTDPPAQGSDGYR